MHYDIAFPNLGIYLDHVGKNIDIFGFTIAYYGIIIGCAILIGFLIAMAEAKRTRQNPEDYLDMGIIGVIIGIAGARIYYVVFSWDMYKDNLLEIFNLREGGLAIYGGVIGAVLWRIYGRALRHAPSDGCCEAGRYYRTDAGKHGDDRRGGIHPGESDFSL